MEHKKQPPVGPIVVSIKTDKADVKIEFPSYPVGTYQKEIEIIMSAIKEALK